MMPWGYGHGAGGWLGMLFMGFMMIAFWGGLIVLGFFAVRALTRTTGSGPTSSGTSSTASRPLEILQERYARGEITREQYESMRTDLEH